MSKEEEREESHRVDCNLSSRKCGGNSPPSLKKIRVTENHLGFNEYTEGSTSNVRSKTRVRKTLLGYGTEGSSSNEGERIMVRENTIGFNENPEGSTPNEGQIDGSSDVVEPQDADYSYIPSLSDELVHQILARVPRSEYWKLSFVNKWCLSLLQSGELYKFRKDLGTMEPSVFMLPLASGDPQWWSLDNKFMSCRRLPVLPSDSCFAAGDKESLCAGTHLLVSGKEIEGVVIWRYELSVNRWYKGPSMINPRCLFASASCGDVAYVAGGIGVGRNIEVLNSVELYNAESKSWEPLPKMQKPRKLCSGCYLDNKFYVIGGQGVDGVDLTCGERFDTERNTWELIPEMIKDVPNPTSRSPPLLAVVNNELYTLDASSNKLKVYLKKTNSWKELGNVPVRADHSRGWGVAFKSLGNELLVIGGTINAFAGQGAMIMCTCTPDPEGNELIWRRVGNGRNWMSNFILNCSVMIA